VIAWVMFVIVVLVENPWSAQRLALSRAPQ
jgi:hypothetical protein